MRRVALLLSLLLVPSPARATVLVPIEFRELVAIAPVIVHGTVGAVHSEWSDGRRGIETLITINATEYLKGNLGPEITIRVPGGRVGRYLTVFVGAPVFRAGDEVVLFLNASGASYPFVIGLSQGAFRVLAQPGTGARLVTPPIVMGQTAADTSPIVRGDVTRRPVAWERFRDVVRQVMADAGAR